MKSEKLTEKFGALYTEYQKEPAEFSRVSVKRNRNQVICG